MGLLRQRGGAVCDQTYRGTSAGSEPEDTAIVNKIRALVPGQRGPGDTDAAPLTTTGVYQLHPHGCASQPHSVGLECSHMPNYAETFNIAAHERAERGR